MHRKYQAGQDGIVGAVVKRWTSIEDGLKCIVRLTSRSFAVPRIAIQSIYQPIFKRVNLFPHDLILAIKP
jgi:hypothetical protein